MPEYLAPGVFVEETSFRSKSIEGVSTTTTAFVGPTRWGPVDLEPELVTSLVELERSYGSRRPLDYASDVPNFMWQAARAFFEEGGKRLYVARVFLGQNDSEYAGFDENTQIADDTDYADGHARGVVNEGGEAEEQITVAARYPGEAGNFRLRFTVTLGKNILSFREDAAGVSKPVLAGLTDRDVVQIRPNSSGSAAAGPYYIASWDGARNQWQFLGDDDSTVEPTELDEGDQVQVLSLQLTVSPVDEPGMPEWTWTLALDPAHQRGGAPDSFSARFVIDEDAPARGRDLPIFVTVSDDVDGLGLLEILQQHAYGLSPPPATTDDELLSFELVLEGGNDGARPGPTEYEGKAEPTDTRKSGLKALEDLEDVSIVAAPGATYGYTTGDTEAESARAVMNLLISHATRMRYRIAVLDSGDKQSLSDIRDLRAQLDSKYAALYYPWVRVLDPVTRQPIHLPPSGFVAGIYARNDIERGVYKAPANEVVNLATGFEVSLNKAQQEVLNPEGINAFRFFEGRGYRLWGARTISSDPEWKYVNLRRYFNYLERSIDKGTQWAVFEPNGEALWANVRRTVEDFLFNEWQSGALLGDKPEKSYFVRCDRSTMTQNDLDNGRLICLIGVAPLRPAEFVIFRIGQKTANA